MLLNYEFFNNLNYILKQLLKALTFRMVLYIKLL